jgi:hypothetical protein
VLRRSVLGVVTAGRNHSEEVYRKLFGDLAPRGKSSFMRFQYHDIIMSSQDTCNTWLCVDQE